LSTIDCLDYSPALSLIAFGSVQGKVGFVDSLTLMPRGYYEAHHREVHAVCFFDKELLLISLALDGEMILWDG
jgi:sporulation-control protein spo0M